MVHSGAPQIRNCSSFLLLMFLKIAKYKVHLKSNNVLRTLCVDFILLCMVDGRLAMPQESTYREVCAFVFLTALYNGEKSQPRNPIIL